MNPDNGTLDFPRFGDSTPLVPESLEVSGCYYRIPEDFVVPANSKAHLKVEAMLSGFDAPSVSNMVECDRVCESQEEDSAYVPRSVVCFEFPLVCC